MSLGGYFSLLDVIVWKIDVVNFTYEDMGRKV